MHLVMSRVKLIGKMKLFYHEYVFLKFIAQNLYHDASHTGHVTIR